MLGPATAPDATPVGGADAQTCRRVGLQIATAALDPRVTCPACGPAWMTLHGGHGLMRLIDLDKVLPDPWRVAREEDERKRREQQRHEMDPCD